MRIVKTDYDLEKAEKVMEHFLPDKPEALYRTENGNYFFVIHSPRKEENIISIEQDEILPIESKDQIMDWFELIFDNL